VSRVGRAAANALIRFYPRAWRSRYAGELRDLIDEADAGVREVFDLAAGAIHQHTIGGAPVRFEPAYNHPSAFAVLALAITAPTMAFVALSILGHELGASAVAAFVDPIIEAVTAPRIVDLALVAAPAVAFVLAFLPLIDARVEHAEGARMVALRVRALPANLAVAALAVLLGAALMAHVIAESMLSVGA